MMKTPVIIVNFKTYSTASGKNAVALAKICGKVAKETGVSVAVAVSALDVHSVASAVSIPVFCQHIDDAEPGQSTGAITAENAKENGAFGTLLNHSEKRLRIDVLEKSIKKAKEAGLFVVACANDSDTGKAISAFDADMIAVEPPELIGGNVSVSSAKPGVISDSVLKICGRQKCSRVIVGAGVKTKEDVKKAIELGASGVLVASGVAAAKEPEKALRELVEGLKQ